MSLDSTVKRKAKGKQLQDIQEHEQEVAKLAALEQKVNAVTLGRVPKGPWDPKTNTPDLIATLIAEETGVDKQGFSLLAKMPPKETFYSPITNSNVHNGDLFIRYGNEIVQIENALVPGDWTVSLEKLTPDFPLADLPPALGRENEAFIIAARGGEELWSVDSAGRITNVHIQEIEKSLADKLTAFFARGNTQEIEFAVVDLLGAVLFGVRANGTVSNKQIDQMAADVAYLLANPVPDNSITTPKLALRAVQGPNIGLQAIQMENISPTIQPPFSVPPAAGRENEAFVFTDANGNVLASLNADTSWNSPFFNALVEAIASKLSGILAKGNDLDTAFSIVATGGEHLFGVRPNATIANKQIDEMVSDITALKTNSIVPQIVNFILVSGQSNAESDANWSQTHRPPMNFGQYPPNYTGEQDGPGTITNAAYGKTRTLNSARSALIPLVGTIFGNYYEGVGHGFADPIAKAYPNHEMILAANAVGGKLIEYLDKPTAAEITAGSATGIAIPTTSGEYLLQSNNKSIDKILDYGYLTYATPYYKGLWLIAQAKALVAQEGKKLVVPAMLWIQGESNSGTATYASLLYSLYDTFNQDVRLITGQTTNVEMIIEESNYSAQNEIEGSKGFDDWKASGYQDSYAPGGANSAYIKEYDPVTKTGRVNSHFGLNLLQLTASKDGPDLSPARNITLASCRYPIASRIHMMPHVQRRHGEYLSKVYRKVVIEGKRWRPMQPVSVWMDGIYIYIRFHLPRPGLRFEIPPNSPVQDHVIKPGKPYGLEHSAGDIQLANVQIIGADTIRIQPDVAPAPGQKISYLKSCRTGSLCDSDTTLAMYPDRAGGYGELPNYCVPFEETLK